MLHEVFPRNLSTFRQDIFVYLSIKVIMLLVDRPGGLMLKLSQFIRVCVPHIRHLSIQRSNNISL